MERKRSEADMIVEFWRGLLTAALLVSVALPAAGEKLYKWVDEDGNVHYSNTMPPEAVRQGGDILNDQGVVVDRKKGAKTEAEKAREARERRAEAERRKQAAHDEMLLSTFSSVEEMIRFRDRKIEAIESRIQLARGRMTDLQTTLDALMERAARRERRGEPVPKSLAERIEQTQRQLENQRSFIEDKKAEQAQVRERFKRDIQRYRELMSEKENEGNDDS